MNKVQRALLVMMDDLDAVLRTAGIPYTLAFGSALGAVRHKGFIPWDDDMDVLIHRDYEVRMVQALKEGLDPKKYTLVEPYTQDWLRTYYKVKLNNSLAIEEKYKNTRVHQGLFIDIFIAYPYPRSMVRRAFYGAFMRFDALLHVISDGQIGNEKYDLMMRPIFFLYRATSKLLDFVTEGVVDKYTPRTTTWKKLIDASCFDVHMDIEFENDHCYMITREWDMMLTDEFGDYMTPPPEEERTTHLIEYHLDDVLEEVDP